MPAVPGPKIPARPPRSPGLPFLLGLGSPDPETLSRVHRALVDDRLTATDIIPLLVLASTPDAPFTLVYDEQNSAPSLAKVMAPFLRFVGEKPGDEALSFTPGEVEPPVRRSPAVWLQRKLVNRRGQRVLIGRHAYGQDLAAAMRPVFQTLAAGADTTLATHSDTRLPIDFGAYARLLEGCGHLFNLQEAARLVEPGRLTPADASRLVRHLRAAAALSQATPAQAALGASGKPWSDGSPRQMMLMDAWTSLADRLPLVAPAADWATNDIAMEAIGLAFGAAAPLREPAYARLLAMLADPAPPAPLTLENMVTHHVSGTLSALSTLDPDYAERRLRHLLAHPWAAIAAAAGGTLEARLVTLRAALPSLPDRLAGAASHEAFAIMLRAHAGDLPRFMALCYCLAAATAQDIHTQLRLAETMQRHRAVGLSIRKDIDFAPPRLGEPHPPCRIVDHLADPNTAAFIAEAVRTTAGFVEAEAVYLGSFDRLDAEIANVVEVVMSHSAGGTVRPAR